MVSRALCTHAPISGGGGIIYRSEEDMYNEKNPHQDRHKTEATLIKIGDTFNPELCEVNAEYDIVRTIESLSKGLQLLKDEYWPIEIKELRQVNVVFKTQLKLYYHFDFELGCFWLEHPELGVHAYADSIEHMYYIVDEDLSVTWEHIVLEDDDKLGGHAQEVKKNFLALVKKESNENGRLIRFATKELMHAEHKRITALVIDLPKHST